MVICIAAMGTTTIDKFSKWNKKQSLE
jgi:hypothetical protein